MEQKTFSRNADLIIAVFDLSNSEFEQKVNYWINLVPETKTKPVLFVGSKLDIVDPTNVSEFELVVKEISPSSKIVCCSAKTRENFDKLVEIIQHVSLAKLEALETPPENKQCIVQ